MLVLLLYLIFTLIICCGAVAYNYYNKQQEGSKGLKGFPGPRGDKGDIGDKGDKGRMGPRGLRGIRGDNNSIQGIRGDKGYMGPKGDKGFQGYRGFKGPKGYDGEIGRPGLQGKIGDTGPPGPQGDPGEYTYTDIDYKSCKTITFDKKTREMKCPRNHILTGINNVDDNYDGYCCKLKINESCRNMPLAKLLNDHKPEMVGTEYEPNYLTEKEERRKYGYMSFYNQNYYKLYYLDNYKCETGKPKIKGDSSKIRCCNEETNNIIEEEEEKEELNYEKLKY